MGYLLVFNPLRHLISYFLSFSSFLFYLSFFFSLMLSLSLSLSLCLSLSLPFFLSSYLLQPLAVPPSQYLPKHYRDHRPKHAEMSFKEFIEFMKRIDATNIQWVVEWWRISSMAHRSLKENCVPLVGLHYCSYHSACHIAK